MRQTKNSRLNDLVKFLKFSIILLFLLSFLSATLTFLLSTVRENEKEKRLRLEAIRAELEEQIETLESEQAALKQKISSLELARQEFTQKLAEEQSARLKAIEMLRQKDDELGKLRTERDQSKRAYDALQKERWQLERELEQLETKLRAVEAENRRLELQIQTGVSEFQVRSGAPIPTGSSPSTSESNIFLIPKEEYHPIPAEKAESKKSEKKEKPKKEKEKEKSEKSAPSIIPIQEPIKAPVEMKPAPQAKPVPSVPKVAPLASEKQPLKSSELRPLSGPPKTVLSKKSDVKAEMPQPKKKKRRFLWIFGSREDKKQRQEQKREEEKQKPEAVKKESKEFKETKQEPEKSKAIKPEPKEIKPVPQEKLAKEAATIPLKPKDIPPASSPMVQKLIPPVSPLVRTNPNPALPQTAPAQQKTVSDAGKVLVLNRKFNFIVVNLGSKQGFEMGDLMSIRKSGRETAKARVEKLYEDYSAAYLVEEQSGAEIQEGDEVVPSEVK